MSLDKIIHERARLRIVTYLARQDKSESSFNNIKDALGFTSGNLSIQLKKLKDASYISVKKTFRDNKPHTSVTLTARGFAALEKYLNEMEDIILSLRK